MAGRTDTRRLQSLLGDPLVRTALALAGAILAVYLLPFLDPQRRTYLLDYVSMVPVAFLGILAPWAFLPPMPSRAEGWFWGLWSGAFAVILAVRIIYIWDAAAASVASGTLATDLLYGLFYLLVVLALMVRPDRPRSLTGLKGLRALETAGTVIFILALLIYFVFLSRSYTPGVYESWVPSLVFYWVLDVFILLTILHLRGTSPSPEWRILYAWLALVPACFVITDLLEYLYYWEVAGGVTAEDAWSVPTYLDFLWYLPWFAAMLAARMRHAPWPSVFAAGAPEEHDSALIRGLGRSGAILLAAVSLPLVHICLEFTGVLDPGASGPRTLLVLLATPILLALAFLHERALARNTLALTRRSEELEENRRILAAAVAQLPDGVLITGADLVVQYVNLAWRTDDAGTGEVRGSHLLRALPEGLDREDRVRLESALENGEPWDGRLMVRTPEGDVLEEVLSVSPVRGEAGEVIHWVAIRNDVTYLARLERQLGQAQKMEALGTLAGGIAHDFNNILGAIYGYGEILALEMEPNSQAREDLRGLLTAAERAAELVSQILTFSRQGEEERRVLLLEPVVREALSLLKATLPSTIEIRQHLDAPHCRLLGVRHQIHQVLLNLGGNAAQAMGEDGGILEVGLQPVALDDATALKLGLPSAGVHVLLTVRDTGSGMDRAVLSRIFDPFFTTKEVGKGTGLGLSVVHGAVAAHQGVIRVESEPGEGSTFEIFLPCRDLDLEEEEESMGTVQLPVGDGRRILVVDDEPMLASLARQLLEGMGFVVESFTVSREALDRFSRRPGDFHLILTDQTMPGITGLELARRVREISPELPVVLTTGYSEILTGERLAKAGVRQVLTKPFNRRDLGRAMAEALDT